MRALVIFLHRFLAPFVAGCLMAGAILSDDMIMAGLMAAAAGLLLIANLSFNSRMVALMRSPRNADK